MYRETVPYNAGAVGFGGEDRNSVTIRPFDRGALAAQAQSLQIMGAIGNDGRQCPRTAVPFGLIDRH